ncbi:MULTISPECIES: response regulator [unclassified Modicisalibacter]|uniref:ATP-binding response regulator n=1 Tax=unclassified Modicisalibacter TaxID=2679913 RepID=UPI001CC9A761|nr:MULTISPECIES: response regulator [unclassified Modicisalibacter]MBZ9559554.1 response regulator [Modicisalibacter sp. R2A 31.J]MBZ9577006.1 response regulator [Modicisalibacter sp. MOD 31.J]
MPRFGDRLPALLVWLGSLLLAGGFGAMAWLAMGSDTHGLSHDFAHVAAEQATTVRATETGLIREARTLATALAADPLLGREADAAGALHEDARRALRRRLEHYLDGLVDQGVARIAIYPDHATQPLVSVVNTALATRLPGADGDGPDDLSARLVVGDAGVFVRSLAPLGEASRVVIDTVLSRELRALDARIGGGVALLARPPGASTSWELLRRTRPEITAWLNDAELPSSGDEERHTVVDAHGRHFLLTVIPLRFQASVAGSPGSSGHAAIAVWQDVTDELAAYHADRLGTLLRWGGAWVLAQLCLLGLLLGTRRATRRQMVASQRRLQKIASQTPGMIYQFRRSPSGHYSFPYASEAIRTLYEISPEQARQNVDSVFAMIDPRDLPEVQRTIEASAANLTPWQGEYRVHYRDGRMAWMAGQSIPERDDEGGVLWHGFIHDISERKRIEEMKNGFVSTVSHELRTPLTSISGSLKLLNGGALGALPESARPMLKIAEHNAERLTHLINDLLDMDKLVAGQMAFDMQIRALMPLLDEAIESNQGFASQHEVEVVLAARVPEVHVRVDVMRFQQVMANLLSNAIKFSPPQGRVEIQVGLVGAKVRIAVSDRGPGIPVDFQPKIFEKFAQADATTTRQKGGTGLGLAITRDLVMGMKGEIGFETQPGEGTTFHVDLPIPEGAAAGPSAADEAPSPGGSRGNILIVEDEADVASLMRSMLHYRGYRAQVARDAASARSLLTREAFDAVTLDLRLPDEHGLALLRWLRDTPATEGLPVIVVSATSDDGLLPLDGSLAVQDWLVKPIDDARLARALRKALGGGRSLPRVLYVEDDPDLGDVIAALTRERFDMEIAGSLAAARQCLARDEYALVMLDLQLSDGSGWELLPTIAGLHPRPAVVVVSGRDLSEAELARVDGAIAKSMITQQASLKTLETLLATPRAGG